MPNISEVAKRAKVSRTTVSRVLNEKEDVSEETRRRVMAAIKDMNYRPSALARSLVRQKTDTIGVILSDITDPFFSRIVQGVEDVAHKFDYGTVYASMRWDPKLKHNYINFLRNGRVDGLLMMGHTVGNEDYLREMVEENFPLVLVEYWIEKLHTSFISIDNGGGGYLATKHLLDLGHRRIAHLAGHRKARVSAERLEGYRRALGDFGIPFAEELVVYSDFTTEDAIPAAKKLLTLSVRPTAIFAGNDLMAYGVIHAARELCIEVPRDLALVGFDDIELASMVTPALTTVHQPRLEIGSMAAWTLIQQIENKEIQPTTTELKTSLVVRESCGAGVCKGFGIGLKVEK
ncbi:MAG TPA: LacI family DNA-binding transcriptional regulator [Spirochaetia bacterium]|nr:LacI family DNA-binding transcriptional regulator [Spirochaetia bacterium]